MGKRFCVQKAAGHTTLFQTLLQAVLLFGSTFSIFVLRGDATGLLRTCLRFQRFFAHEDFLRFAECFTASKCNIFTRKQLVFTKWSLKFQIQFQKFFLLLIIKWILIANYLSFSFFKCWLRKESKSFSEIKRCENLPVITSENCRLAFN